MVSNDYLENITTEVKMKRIFTCDSGWCIDLDMITYIGMPNIEGRVVTLKIGIKSSVKDSFIVHEEDYDHLIDEVKWSYREYLKGGEYSIEISQLGGLCINWDTKHERSAVANSGRWDIEAVLQPIDLKVDDMVDKYIEAEFKVFHTKLKNAWYEWVDSVV